MFINYLYQIIVKQLPTSQLEALMQKSIAIKEKIFHLEEAEEGNIGYNILERVISCLRNKEVLIILDSVSHILSEEDEAKEFKIYL